MEFSLGKWVVQAIVIMDGSSTRYPANVCIDRLHDYFGAKSGHFVVWVQQNNTSPAM